jgi:hypothetical protein
MDVANIELSDIRYCDRPPVLIGASSESAMAVAVRTVEAAGWRIADAVSLASTCQRIDQQVAASAIWLELDEDGGAQMDEVLSCVDKTAAGGRFPAVVSSTAGLIDAVSARLASGAAEIIVDADHAERMAALAVVTAAAGWDQKFSDIASDQSAARLRQLSDEVSRIASTLARLSSGPSAPPPVMEPPTRADLPDVSANTVRSIIRARRLRGRFFPEELFADPAWDMLLDLLQAEIAHLRVPVSSLCIAAAVPATTALRWLKTMVANGLFIRRADPHDGRRVFVELSPEASRALHRYFAEVGNPAVV